MRKYTILGFSVGAGLSILGLILLLLVWQLRFLAGAILLMGLLICLFSWLSGWGKKWFSFGMAAGMLFLGSFFLIEFLVFQAMHVSTIPSADIVIILGAKVNGSQPSITLQNRLDAAYTYLLNKPNSLVVVSGGQGIGEDISEAQAMKNYLLERGIQENRIFLEPESKTTRENLCYSQQILKAAGHSSQRVLIVTSDYHLFRACWLAKQYFTSVDGLPGQSEWAMCVNYAIREYFAVSKMFLLREG